MGATNCLDIIDPAVIRLGQFDPLLPLSITGPSVTPDTMKYYESLKSELQKKRSKQIESGIYG